MKIYLFCLCLLVTTCLCFSVHAGDITVSQRDTAPVIDQESSDAQSDVEMEEDLFDEYNEEDEPVADPLYGFNYAMYAFNDALYFYALKPVATGYKAVVPTPVRKGVDNFFHNLFFPVRFVNNVLQGKFASASEEVGVFLVNSTIGVLGLMQVAQNHFDLQTQSEDFGQTLGSYSMGEGFYLVLPILGPSTFRDLLGRVPDYFLSPVTYAEPWELKLGATALDKINSTSFRLGDYEALKEAALDPYSALRNAYIQNRRNMISN